MEKITPSSLHICQSIIFNVMDRTVLPPKPHQILAYSKHHSQQITQTIVSPKLIHDQSPKRLSQDIPQFKKLSTFHQTRKRPSGVPTPSLRQTPVFSSTPKCTDQFEYINGGLGLVPLNKIEFDSDDEPEVEDEESLEDRMRDAKVHQEIVRAQYNSAMKEVSKRQKKVVKVQGKNQNNKTIYDYDGSLIPSFKTDKIRFPGHFIDLEVSVDEKQDPSSTILHKISKKYIKINSKPDYLIGKKKQLKVNQSIFLKEFSNINWVDGVEPLSKKESCRKILGYNNQKNIRKKKFNLFAASQGPRQMKLEQLENYRYGGKFASMSTVHNQSQKSVLSYQTILDKEDSGAQCEKTIKIANNKALQFLIRDQDKKKSNANESKTSAKKSNFCPQLNNRFSNL